MQRLARIGFGFGCVSALVAMSASVATVGLSADGLPQAAGEPLETQARIHALLREAGEIVRRQGEPQRDWTRWARIEIGNLQIRAGDFEGALDTFRAAPEPDDRGVGLVRLAEATARDGQRLRAFEILRIVSPPHHDWDRVHVNDGVQMRWIEHLVARGDLDGAAQAVEQLKTRYLVPQGLRKLAAAYAAAGEARRAAECFRRAIPAAIAMEEDDARASNLVEIAEAQRATGAAADAKATLRRLTDELKFDDPWVKLRVLCDAAEVAARAGDRAAARDLFARAVDAQMGVDDSKKIDVWEMIAHSQAAVGYVDDALGTARLIVHDDVELFNDMSREGALCAVALAQLRAGDAAGAERTARSIEYCEQFRDEGLRAIVDYRLAKRDFEAALRAALGMKNPSQRAVALLGIAVAHARAGRPEFARRLAATIGLAKVFHTGVARYDFQSPRTWYVPYDQGAVISSITQGVVVQHAADVAAASMSLALALGGQPKDPYAVSFDKIDEEEIVRSLARTHAAQGDAGDALAWARRIGDEGVAADDEAAAGRARRRIFALIGVADGLLERSSVPERK